MEMKTSVNIDFSWIKTQLELLIFIFKWKENKPEGLRHSWAQCRTNMENSNLTSVVPIQKEIKGVKGFIVNIF